MITKYRKPTLYAIAHWFKLFLFFEGRRIYFLSQQERIIWLMRAFAPLILWCEDIGYDPFNYWMLWELTLRDFPRLATTQIRIWEGLPEVLKDYLLCFYIMRIERRNRLYVDLWYLTNPALLQQRPMFDIRPTNYRKVGNSADDYVFEVLRFLTYPFVYMKEKIDLLDYLFVYEWFGEETFSEMLSRGVLLWVGKK